MNNTFGYGLPPNILDESEDGRGYGCGDTQSSGNIERDGYGYGKEAGCDSGAGCGQGFHWFNDLGTGFLQCDGVG
jgi:hypothetical protein